MRSRENRYFLVVQRAKMAGDAAALLDQLMGANRNADPGDLPKEASWRDAEVRSQHFQVFERSFL